MSRRVLILGGRAPVALDHARRFHRQGWRVQVADSASCRLCSWSASVEQAHVLPAPREDGRAFIARLSRIVAQQEIDLLLPTCEEALYVSRFRPALPAGLQVAVDGFDRLRALHGKGDFMRLARGAGLAVPDGARIGTLEQARDWARGRGVVLKPDYSRFGVHVRIHPDGIPVSAPALPPGTGPWIVQEFLAGDELCSYSIAHRGRLLAHAAYRPAYRLGRSASYYFDPVRRPAIRDAVARFVASLGLTGQLAFDWIESPTRGAVAIECNPRATSGVHLFGADADLPSAILGDAATPDPDGARAKAIAPVLLTAGLRSAARSGRIAAWMRDCRRADDVLSVPGDRLPAAGAIRDLGAHAWRALRRRHGLREASTRDIEWDGGPMTGDSP